MSIAEKVTALQNAKEGIRTALLNKKVVLADNAGFNAFKTVLEDNTTNGTNLRRFRNVQRNSTDAGCSTNQITFDCPFQPDQIMFSFNSNSFSSQQITSGTLASGAAVYVYKNGTSMGRTQITENVPDYWYYQDGKVYINKVTSSIGWASNNYWFFCIG